MDIGKRIREAREELGMPRSVLARRVEAAPNHLYMIESGERLPSLGLLEKIAHTLRVAPADLLREASEEGAADAPLGQGLGQGAAVA
jgi:transcriptional regulator with XRE-family HTH domain